MLDGVDFDTRLRWIRRVMPLTNAVISGMKADFSGLRLACAAHFDIKLVPLFEKLLEKKVELHLSPCVPGIVFEDSFQYLREKGAKFYGAQDKAWDQLEASWKSITKVNPAYIFDMGGGLIAKALTEGVKIKAACEATGTGIDKISKLKLNFPVFNWDDMHFKEILHNRYDVGNGIWYAFRHLTGLDVCRLNILVVGFGNVGKSVASVARGLGARVMICERNPLLSIEAASDGYQTPDLERALRSADVVITATGSQKVITSSHLKNAKTGLFIGNAGHDSREVDLGDSESTALLPHVDQFDLHGKSFYLLAKGTLLNLAAGGSSFNTFDYITALMGRVIEFMVDRGKEYSPGVHVFPESAIQDLIDSGFNRVTI